MLTPEQLAELRRRVRLNGCLFHDDALAVLRELEARRAFDEAGVAPPRYPVRVTVIEATSD